MTSKIHAKRTTLERGESVHTEFDAVDNKGRRFGARIRTYVIEYAPADASVVCPYIISEDMLGRWFHVVPHATRNGYDYGAYQSGKIFREESEVAAYIAKYLADAEKRALKNKARVA